jgi:hypothetical protein
MPMIDDNEVQDELEAQDGVSDPCSLCGGDLEPLGILGCMLHLRCRHCGMMFNRPVAGCGD